MGSKVQRFGLVINNYFIDLHRRLTARGTFEKPEQPESLENLF